MENPNLNKIMSEKLTAILSQLSDLRFALEDRWIATDTHLYEKVHDSIEDIRTYMFGTSEEDLQKDLEAYKVAEETYNAGVVAVKEVKHLKTGELVKIRIHKRQVQHEGGVAYGKLKIQQIETELKNNNTIYVAGKFIPNPFISDGVTVVKD